MNMAINHENDEFLVINFEHVWSLQIPWTPKVWTIANKNGHRKQKQRVLGHALKTVTGLTCLENPIGVARHVRPITFLKYMTKNS